MYKIMSYKNISNDKILVSYIPKLDYNIIRDHKLDFIKIVDKFKDNEVQGLNVTSIPMSAAVTAYGRIHMNKLKLDMLKNGNEVYYTDTDSIVCSKPLSDNLVNNLELGKLKLEYILDKAIFISNKLYFLCDDKGNFINKAKGIKSDSITYFDYVRLLNNKSINTAVKTESKIN